MYMNIIGAICSKTYGLTWMLSSSCRKFKRYSYENTTCYEYAHQFPYVYEPITVASVDGFSLRGFYKEKLVHLIHEAAQQPINISTSESNFVFLNICFFLFTASKLQWLCSCCFAHILLMRDKMIPSTKFDANNKRGFSLKLKNIQSSIFIVNKTVLNI